MPVMNGDQLWRESTWFFPCFSTNRGEIIALPKRVYLLFFPGSKRVFFSSSFTDERTDSECLSGDEYI